MFFAARKAADLEAIDELLSLLSESDDSGIAVGATNSLSWLIAYVESTVLNERPFWLLAEVRAFFIFSSANCFRE